MADAEHQELIIIRRHEDEEHEAHSSAWKVAHADFMTAMMAFFLIMWLINATDEEIKKSIANYFNPVKLSSSVTDRKGLNNPDEIHPQGSGEEGDHKSTLDTTPEDKSEVESDLVQSGVSEAEANPSDEHEEGAEEASPHTADAEETEGQETGAHEMEAGEAAVHETAAHEVDPQEATAAAEESPVPGAP